MGLLDSQATLGSTRSLVAFVLVLVLFAVIEWRLAAWFSRRLGVQRVGRLDLPADQHTATALAEATALQLEWKLRVMAAYGLLLGAFMGSQLHWIGAFPGGAIGAALGAAGRHLSARSRARRARGSAALV